MYYKCCVPGCVSSRQKYRLHKFPKCEKRLQLWLDSINSDYLRKQSLGSLAHLQVCHKHFEARFVTKKSRILSTAYPTLFLESEIISGVPIKPFEAQDSVDNNKDKKVIHNDHNYCKLKETHKQYIQACTEVLLDRPTPIEDSGQHCPLFCELIPLPSTTPACFEYSQPSAGGLPIITLSFQSQDQNTLSQPQFNDSELLPSISPDHVVYGQNAAEISGGLPIISMNSSGLESQDQNTPPQPQLNGSIKSTKKRRFKSKPFLKNVKASSPDCQNLYKKYRKLQKLLCSTRRAKRELKLRQKNAFENMIEGMNPIGKKLLLMQVKLCAKKDKGRRFTQEEKMIALSILKEGLNVYKFLQKIFILPSKTTLKKMNLTSDVDNGIDNQIFDTSSELSAEE